MVVVSIVLLFCVLIIFNMIFFNEAAAGRLGSVMPRSVGFGIQSRGLDTGFQQLPFDEPHDVPPIPADAVAAVDPAMGTPTGDVESGLSSTRTVRLSEMLCGPVVVQLCIAALAVMLSQFSGLKSNFCN